MGLWLVSNSPRHLRGCNIYCCFSDTGVLMPQDYKHTDPDHPLATRLFFKGQNNQKLCLSGILVSQLTRFFCTIFCVCYQVIYRVFHPPDIHSVSNPCNISLGHLFWQVFYWLAANYILTYFPEIQQIFS